MREAGNLLPEHSVAGSLRLAFLLARRELRSGLAGFRVFLACLALGVAAIAAVGSLTEAFSTGLSLEAKSILGGDVEILLTQRDFTAQEKAWARAQGQASQVREIRVMARGLATDIRNLVEVKVTDELYPLYGGVEFEPEADITLAAALVKRAGRWGAAVDSKVLSRLGVAVGDLVRLGTLDVEVRAVIAREPDRMGAGGFIMPRVFIDRGALAETGLVQEGSRLEYKIRLILNKGVDAAGFRQEAARAFPASPWRIRNPSEGMTGAQNFIDRVSLFLTLVGLTALFIGGIGVGNAIRAHLDGKREDIAILKCLGATGFLVFQVFLIQVFLLALVGIIFGLMIGIIAPIIVTASLGDLLPVAAPFALYPQALGIAGLYGVLITLAFAIWPIARAREISPANLFRDLVSPAIRRPSVGFVAASIAAFASLGLLAVAMTPYKSFAWIFLAGAGAAFLLLRLEAAGLMALAKAVGRPRHAGLRLALTNLYRPGAPTVSVVLSLGLGLTLLVGVSQIDGNITNQISDQIPDRAPSFFMLDIRRDQVAAFDALVASFPQAQDFQRVPIVRASISKVNGVPSAQVVVQPESRWVLEDERNITYTDKMPENSAVVAGTWWGSDYRGPPAISIGDKIARDLGVGLGDHLSFQIVGREIEAVITNLRAVDFTQGGMNFAVIFAPGALEQAPQQHLSTLRLSADQEEAFQKAVTGAFPNISVIWVRETVEAVKGLLQDLAIAVRATSAITLLAGVFVLAGAMASGHRRRVYDAVILKVLGATKRRIMAAYLLEYALLGLGTAGVAAGVGTLAAYLIVSGLWGEGWVFYPLTLASTVVGTGVIMAFLGFIGTWRALTQKPAEILRSE